MPIPIPFRFEDERLLWCVDDVYSPEECRWFVAEIEAARPALATVNQGYRDQDRVIRDDPVIAGELFRRLESHLPPKMGQLRLLGLNERLRMYRYRPGQQFAPHMDHWYRDGDTRITLHTALVYFNADFTGGETRFTEQIDETVIPKPGRVAIFQHKVRHEGCRVLTGTKYAMRADVIYGPPPGETIGGLVTAGG